jgi:hypothetical protein
MSDEPTPPSTATQAESSGQSLNEKRRAERRSELHSLIEQLQSPISGDEVARVTAIAAGTIRELWKEVESLRADREHFRQSGSTLADDLRAAQERTDDSKTRFLLGGAADEIEMLRQKHRHTVDIYQGKVRYLGERLEACKADLEQFRQSGRERRQSRSDDEPER